jgi:hypothetical protein
MSPRELEIIQSWASEHDFISFVFVVGMVCTITIALCVGVFTDYNGPDWQGDQFITAMLIGGIPSCLPVAAYALNCAIFACRDKIGMTPEARQAKQADQQRQIEVQKRRISELERELEIAP